MPPHEAHDNKNIIRIITLLLHQQLILKDNCIFTKSNNYYKKITFCFNYLKSITLHFNHFDIN